MTPSNPDFRRRTQLLALAVVGVVVVCDRATKELARHYLADVPPYRAFEVMPDLVYLHLSTNDAGMFGLLAALPPGVKTPLFLALTVGFVGYLGWLLWRATPDQVGEVAPIALLLAGFVGNGLDRILYGAVIDFAVVHLPGGAVGANIADVAIFSALAWIVGGRLVRLARPTAETSEG